jgi:hypothetical protein
VEPFTFLVIANPCESRVKQSTDERGVSLYGERQAFACASGGLLRRYATRNDAAAVIRFERITL